MTKTLTACLAVLAPLAALYATPAHAWPFGTQGNGQKTTETRPLKGFDKIRLKGSMDAEVRQGTDFSVAVTTDSNLQKLVRTEVSGSTLVIDLKDNVNFSRGRHVVAITLPAFRGLEIEGSGDAEITGFKDAKDVSLETHGSGDIRYSGNAAKLSVLVEGSGDIKLEEGKADRLTVNVNGSGDVQAKDLSAKDVMVEINGSGAADVRVNGGSFSASVNGSGDITWRGQAAQVSTAAHGSGDITRKNG